MSLRAYGAQEAFIQESMKRLDRYTRAASTFYNLNRWVCIRIDALGGLFAAGLATYLVYFKSPGASNTGFSLNMAGMSEWMGFGRTAELTHNSGVQYHDPLVDTKAQRA